MLQLLNSLCRLSLQIEATRDYPCLLKAVFSTSMPQTTTFFLHDCLKHLAHPSSRQQIAPSIFPGNGLDNLMQEPLKRACLPMLLAT
jgi:hypothetical protein